MARKSFIFFAAVALGSVAFAQTAMNTQSTTTARETGTGVATGKKTGVQHLSSQGIVHRDLAARGASNGQTGDVAPADVQTARETGSGMATGRKTRGTMSSAQSNPMYKGDGKSGTNPLYEGSQRQGAVTPGNGSTTAAGASTTAVVKTKTKSNQSNDRLLNAGPKNGTAEAPSGEAAVIKTKTKSNQSNDRTASGGVGVAAGDVDGDGAAGRLTKSRSNIQNNRVQSGVNQAAGAVASGANMAAGDVNGNGPAEASINTTRSNIKHQSVAAGDATGDGSDKAAPKKVDPYGNITWGSTGTGSSTNSKSAAEREALRKQQKAAGSADPQ
jgi:hypothetical protein